MVPVSIKIINARARARYNILHYLPSTFSNAIFSQPCIKVPEYCGLQVLTSVDWSRFQSLYSNVDRISVFFIVTMPFGGDK